MVRNGNNCVHSNSLFIGNLHLSDDKSFYIKSTLGAWIVRPEGQKVYGKAFQMCLPFLSEEFYLSKRFHKEDVESFVISVRVQE